MLWSHSRRLIEVIRIQFISLIPQNRHSTFEIAGFKVGLGILEIKSAKRSPQVWPQNYRSLYTTKVFDFELRAVRWKINGTRTLGHPLVPGFTTGTIKVRSGTKTISA